MRHIAMTAAAVGIMASVAFSQLTANTFHGDSPNDQFGWSVSGAGDVNGDGFADLIVGANEDDNNGTDSGSARVISGVDGSILFNLDGDSAYDNFGISVSGAGDVNGDGFADLIVGANEDDNGGYNSGSARVFSGLDGSILYTFNGDSASDYFGRSVCGAGDVNGDGFADLIVGAPGDDNTGADSGSARVFSGFDGSVLYTFNGDSAGDSMGGSVSGAGDVNGDGFADLLVGAHADDNNGTNSGSARVFSGADGSILYTFLGSSAGYNFGSSVSGAGDVNADGFADLIVGAQFGNNFSGEAQVFSGLDGTTIFSFLGISYLDYFGYSVSGVGDVNGDGFSDVVVGAIDDINGTNSGSARVFSGADGSTLFTFIGDNALDVFGSSVSDAGDVNGDGIADLLVGAYGDDNNGSSSGSARVFIMPTPPPPSIGGGQPNSMAASLLVNDIPTGSAAGPFISTITRGQNATFDLYGASNVFYEVYASQVLSPGGWIFPGFGSFDLGTGPTFIDCYILLPGFQTYFPLFALDATGQSHISSYVHPSLTPGPLISVQAVIQNAQPWTNGIWATITAAHVLVVQ